MSTHRKNASFLAPSLPLLGAIVTVLAAPGQAEATSARGAVLLRGDQDVRVEGEVTGVAPQHDTFWHWEGDTLFIGAADPSSGNQVEALAEFYWFETSLDRSSDFYSVVLKVKSSPAARNDWGLEVDPGDAWYRADGEFLPCQEVVATVHPSGSGGGIRWDWSVPFTDYKWDPMREIEVEQGYSLGIGSEGTVVSELNPDGTKTRIMGKGSFDWSRKVSSNYTITLFAWQMLVAGGGERQSWQLGLQDEDRADQSAYHEYMLILQTGRGEAAVIDALEFVGSFRRERFLGADDLQVLSAMLSNIVVNAPADTDRTDPERREGDVTGGADDGGSDRTRGEGEGGEGEGGDAELPPEPAARPILLSELYMDADLSFVELSGAPGQALDGLTLFGVDGHNGQAYLQLQLDGHRINAEGWFVIASSAAVPGADLVDPAARLQPAPSNLLLVRRDAETAIDAVGYGPFGPASFFAGELSPAPAQGGMATGRTTPFDRDDNGLDFTLLAAPTPGALNHPLRDTSAPSVECLHHSECPTGRICSPLGTCINECATDRDCGPGGLCKHGSCVPTDAPTSGDSPFECQRDSDCDEYSICNPAGACIPECATDRDCPYTATCSLGRCEAGTNAAWESPGYQSPVASGGCNQAGTSAEHALFLTFVTFLAGALRRRRRLS